MEMKDMLAPKPIELPEDPGANATDDLQAGIVAHPNSPLLWALLVERNLTFYPVWLAVTAVFVAERVVTVRSRGPAQMLVGAVLVVEMVYDVFLQLVQARAFIDAAIRRERKW